MAKEQFSTDPGYEPEAPSRSELKRRSLARQKLGEELAALPFALLQKFSISEDLRNAFEEYARIKSHEGRRRQLQFIGRLMRDENSEQIALELAALKSGQALHTEAFHNLERLRDSLLQENTEAWDDVEKALAWQEPEQRAASLEELRKLARVAVQQKNKGSSRALFRALRQLAL